MTRRKLIVIGLPVLLVLIAGGIALLVLRTYILRPASAPTNFRLVEVMKGFTRPVYVTHAGDHSGRLFVEEQDGLIRVLQNGKLLDTPFLDVSSLVSRDGSERGLLGLAFHPHYAQNGLFFINYTDKQGNTNVVRYQVSASNPNLADPASAKRIIEVDQPFPNHNAGQLAFGPDGYLYVGLGDGGSAGDPNGNGQNPKALLGKMLRLDVDSNQKPYGIPKDNPFTNNSQYAPEIWAMGLRNPWRYSFDPSTGDLYIGDVGQGAWEEIDFQPAGDKGGENYGWNILEGNHSYSNQAAPANLTAPVAEYSHADGCSVTGGYVYRGQKLADLQGMYFYADWCTGTMWMLRRESGRWQHYAPVNTGRMISSFGEDEEGELYLVDYNGALLRLEPAG